MNKCFLSIAFVVMSLYCFSQDTYTISGYVTDKSSGENLIGVSIYTLPGYKGTASNNYGFYTLSIPEGEYEIIYQSIGYKTFKKKLTVDKNISLKIELENYTIITEEVTVTGERLDKNITSSNMSQAKIEVENIKQLPVILGEVDVLKSAQLLPGIQSGGEGTAGFYVRGGGPDQNLILLDEAVVYNASHLFGFFSVFNNDAINNIELIKGSMPANYRGRLSSVLDINMKNGNNKKFGAEGGVSLISS